MSTFANSSFLNSSKKSTIVITGGATGIGLALAKRFVKQGHVVIVAGRRAAQLELAKAEVPQLKTLQADVETDAGRIAFHKQIISEYPEVNVLINNAALGTILPKLKDTTPEDWARHQSMLAVNLAAPIHLAILFLPQLQAKEHALIANVSSVAAFFAVPVVATYAASKAALHSFTISLRHQLKNTSVAVVEIAPPAVNTPMNKAAELDADTYADDTVAQLLEGKNPEIGYQSDAILRGDRDFLDGLTASFPEELDL